MKKKAAVIIAVVAAVAAIAVFIGVNAGQFRLHRPGRGGLEMKEYSLEDNITDIKVNLLSRDIIFKHIEPGEKSKAEWYEKDGQEVRVEVNDGVLTVTEYNSETLTDALRLNNRNNLITVTLPNADFNLLNAVTKSGDVSVSAGTVFNDIEVKTSSGEISSEGNFLNSIKVDSSSGDIGFSNAQAGKLVLKTGSGDITLKNLENETGEINISTASGDITAQDIDCNFLTVFTEAGECSLEKVLSEVDLNITTSSGEVDIDKSDSNFIKIKTGSGSVNAGFITDKVFTATSENGSVSVPESKAGGKCDITSTDGDINVRITGPDKDEEDYAVNIPMTQETEETENEAAETTVKQTEKTTAKKSEKTTEKKAEKTTAKKAENTKATSAAKKKEA